MDRTYLEKTLEGKRKVLDRLTREIAAKQKELVERRESYSRGLLTVAEDPDRRLSSLPTQARRVSDTQVELDGMEGTRTMVEKEIEALERDLSLADLHDRHVQAFQNSIKSCEKALDVLGNTDSLNQHVREVVVAIETLFRQVEAGIDAIKTVNHRLDGYSLESFLNGEFLMTEDEDRESVLEKIGTQLKNFARQDVHLDLGAFSRLSELIQLYPHWRSKVCGFRNGRDLCLSRHSLQPRLPKMNARGESVMAPPYFGDVERHPEHYSPRDFDAARRAAGIPEPEEEMYG